MIEIIRDPVDQIDAWARRGWGNRYCVDPMSLTPCFKHESHAVPFYAYGWEDEYLKMQPIDRIVKMLYHLQLENRRSYESLSISEKEQIFVLRFEDLVSDTEKYVADIAKFLDTSTTKYTKSAIKAQGCPRYQDPAKRVRRLNSITKEATKESLLLVDEMIEDYKSDWV